MKRIKTIIILNMMLLSGIMFACHHSETLPDRQETEVEPESGPEAETGKAGMESESGETAPCVPEEDRQTVISQNPDAQHEAQQKELAVHVCGAVASPGVYRMPEGSLVWDAVQAAGGFTEEAEETWLNLAQYVENAQKLYVPASEELEQLTEQERNRLWQEQTGSISGSNDAGSGRSGETADDRININRAGPEELMTLPGIGESKAQDILRYREINGSFGTVEDIMKVPGIKEGAFGRIKDQITV